MINDRRFYLDNNKIIGLVFESNLPEYNYWSDVAFEINFGKQEPMFLKNGASVASMLKGSVKQSSPQATRQPSPPAAKQSSPPSARQPSPPAAARQPSPPAARQPSPPVAKQPSQSSPQAILNLPVFLFKNSAIDEIKKRQRCSVHACFR